MGIASSVIEKWKSVWRVEIASTLSGISKDPVGSFLDSLIISRVMVVGHEEPSEVVVMDDPKGVVFQGLRQVCVGIPRDEVFESL
jgi:hypothetical protein